MPVVVLEQEAQRWEKMKRKDNAETQISRRYTEKPRRRRDRARRLALTTPDLVLLSLLAERPMHGYQANLELERREIRDWANLSRPQLYYSLEKLERAGLIRAAETGEAAAGPERSTFETTAKGRAAIANALEQQEWTTQRERPAFLTWIALSWLAKPGVFERQLERRRAFLEKETAREKQVLASILEEVGHPYHEAVWMVSLVIDQFQLELKWLEKVAEELPKRERAKRPSYALTEN
jgi:DNA-binding PadR family transcriptional regulator